MMDLFEHATQRDFGTEPDPGRAATRQQEYDAWRLLPGSRHVLKHCHKFAAVYYKEDWLKYHMRVSVKLIWAQVRRKLRIVRAEARLRGYDIKKHKGYSLNDGFTGYVARDLIEHHPEYEVMFELRELRATKPIGEAA